MLISMASIHAIAQADLSFDDTLGNLNMDASNWNTEPSLFDQVQSQPLSNEENIFNLNEDALDQPLLADDPAACLDGLQPLSRIRARAGGGYCAQHGDEPDGRVPGDNQLEREAALTQEKIDQENCPSEYYQGIFLMPVCSLYDDEMMRPSRSIIPASGLKDVWGQLSKSVL